MPDTNNVKYNFRVGQKVVMKIGFSNWPRLFNDKTIYIVEMIELDYSLDSARLNNGYWQKMCDLIPLSKVDKARKAMLLSLQEDITKMRVIRD